MGQVPRHTSSVPAGQASLEGGTGLIYLPHEERMRDGGLAQPGAEAALGGPNSSL